MGQTHRISRNNTKVYRGYNTCTVTLHQTEIVRAERIGHSVLLTLNNGGWDTVTTRTRINQTACEWRLPLRVYREKGQTYIHDFLQDKAVPWVGRMVTSCPVNESEFGIPWKGADND